MKGADFSRESLCREVISNVGPMKSYLETDHTLHHFKEVLWETKLFDRGFLRNWVEGGSKTFEQRVKEAAVELAETSKPERPREDVVHKIDRIIERSRVERKVS